MLEYVPYMRKAIELARRGQFRTCPNPMVGAVLLRDDKIVAEGWHKGFGQPHAEVDCLRDAAGKGVDPKGATMVVTLEPCRHKGKTPPCVEALLDAGIGRLVYGLPDPNPQAAGGAAWLMEHGVEVVGPVDEEACRDLAADFIVWQPTNRPYILLKLASTLDGRIATRNGKSRWISNNDSRVRVQEIRAGIGKCHGAIFIGGGTFRADNPMLTARGDDAADQPLACILTSRLPRPDADFHLLRQRPQQTVFFASPAATASTTAEALRQMGVRVFALGPDAGGGPDFAGMFATMRRELGCPYVLCEGGGKLALAMLQAGFVDEFHLHYAPLVLGDDEARPLFRGAAPLSLDEALHMRICSVGLCSGDAHLLMRPLDKA